MGSFSAVRYVYRVDRHYPFNPSSVRKIVLARGGAILTYVGDVGPRDGYRLEMASPPQAAEGEPKTATLDELVAGRDVLVYLDRRSELPLEPEVTTSYDLPGLVRALVAKGKVETLPTKLALGTHPHRLVAVDAEVREIFGRVKVESDFLLTPRGVEIFHHLEKLVEGEVEVPAGGEGETSEGKEVEVEK